MASRWLVERARPYNRGMRPFADAARLRHEHHHGRVLRCYAARPTSVNALWAATVAVRGGAEALVTPTRRYTYAEVDAHAGRFAAGLAARGIVAGDRIAILCGNEPEFVFALIGALRIGAIAVPINVREQTPELAFILNQCTAKAIVFDAPLAARLPWPDDTPRLRVRVSVGAAAGAEPMERLLETAGAVAPAARHEDETAVLLYTSGTTGHPKGAMLTHFNVVHSALHFRHALGLRPSDRSLLAVPASHVTGLVAVLVAMFECGGCVLALPEFKPAAFLELGTREGMTHTLVVPAIYNLLLRHPAFDPAALAEWRLGGFGGAPMPEGTIRALAERLPDLALFNAYGATETTSPTTVMPPGMQGERLTSVGRVLPCADVRIMDADGREVPPGEPGEIWIAGPMVVPGYWDNPEATAREFSGGYWKSGDIGSCDADGFVYVHDRIKDLVNRGGYKIYCAEVESALSLHADVVEAAVIARPDPVLGEKSVAVVVRRDPACDEAALRAHCARLLADYKVPDDFVIRDAPLPRNANGKILKRALRESHP